MLQRERLIFANMHCKNACLALVVERLAASIRTSWTFDTWNETLARHAFVMAAKIPDFSAVMPVSQTPTTLRRLPIDRAGGWAAYGSELTSLFTKLRLPNRKTRPLLRTVITLALRKMEHRVAAGAGRGTCTLAQIRQSRCRCAGISFV